MKKCVDCKKPFEKGERYGVYGFDREGGYKYLHKNGECSYSEFWRWDEVDGESVRDSKED